MRTAHKNKTFATLYAVVFGGLGLHRFYLRGQRDAVGWAYVISTVLYVAAVAVDLSRGPLASSVVVLFPLPVYIGWIEALTIGVTEDEKWDTRFNPASTRRTYSRWPLVVLLVLTLGGGFVTFIACLARATDLLYTGGSFG